VEQQITFRDHHWFTAADVRRAQQLARDVRADAILTTEKDAVRLELEPAAVDDVPVLFLPIDAHVDPADLFTEWLLDRVGPPRVRR
jgi:tetraacyldisaccharide-1-P 4'-kinase